MAFDAMHGQVVLFGGFGGQNQAFLNDTWLWNGTNWTQANPANSPSPRYSSAMDYDAAQGQVVLFGGYNAYTGAVLGDTWAWNGTRWTQLIPAASPSARYNSAMAYDPAQGQLVLFGGLDAFASGYPFYNDTWVWGPPTDFGNVGIAHLCRPSIRYLWHAAGGDGGRSESGFHAEQHYLCGCGDGGRHVCGEGQLYAGICGLARGRGESGGRQREYFVQQLTGQANRNREQRRCYVNRRCNDHGR